MPHGETMRQIVIMAVALLVFGVLAARFIDQNAARTASSAANAMTASTGTGIAATNSRSVVLTRGNGGHFWTDARVDGRRIEFVVDTGGIGDCAA